MNHRRIIPLGLIALSLSITLACNSATTVAILTAATNSAVSVIGIVAPNWTGLPKLRTDAQAAIAAVSTWKSGTPAQDVVQVLNLVIADINLAPIPPTYQAVIVIALDGVESVITIIEANAPPVPATTAATARVARAGAPAVHYANATSYKAAWNAAVAEHPELASAKLK